MLIEHGMLSAMLIEHGMLSVTQRLGIITLISKGEKDKTGANLTFYNLFIKLSAAV